MVDVPPGRWSIRDENNKKIINGPIWFNVKADKPLTASGSPGELHQKFMEVDGKNYMLKYLRAEGDRRVITVICHNF